MRLSNKINAARALALFACLAIFPLVAFAQDNANTAAQNTQSTNRSTTSTQTTRTTTTTTAPSTIAQTQPAVSRNINGVAEEGSGGINPMWLILGAVALLAIVLIVALSARGRSRSSGTRVETVSETKIKKE